MLGGRIRSLVCHGSATCCCQESIMYPVFFIFAGSVENASVSGVFMMHIALWPQCASHLMP